jgi:hypothetical protein
MRIGPSCIQNRRTLFLSRAGTPEPKTRGLAAELLPLDPDVVLASGSPATAAIRQASAAPDRVRCRLISVGAVFVDSLARPGARDGVSYRRILLGGKRLELTA